jgi:cell division protein FtsI/penicillin-binding protein 2
MAIKPSYDPNYFNKYPRDLWRNRTVTDAYEPGSTFKVITIATALEERVVNLDDQFYCKGWIKYIGTVFHKISLASLSIGQEISVTPIQLIMAISAIANRGTLMKPMIVKEIIDSTQNKIKIFKPKPVRQVVSVDTALTMSKILEQVVNDGTGKRAKLAGYQAAGKTGTAQKFDFSIGKYSEDKYSSFFVGYVPAENPKISILVLLDEPKGSYYGGTVAAPVFQEIASKVLTYLSVPTDE